jgi:hypothetical protein
MKSQESFPNIAQRDVYAWPDGVADAIGLSVQALQRQRAQGDAPKLYAITERKLVTTGQDLLIWIRAKAVPPGYKCRPAVNGRGRAGRAA